MSKIKIVSDTNLVETEEQLEKTLKRKSECSHSEQYADDAFNQFHDMICEKHEKLVKNIMKDIETEIERHAGSKGNY